MVDLHNAARARRGAKPLVWSADLAAGAQQWANTCVFQVHRGKAVGGCGCWQLATGSVRQHHTWCPCPSQHSGASGVGENLFWSSSASATCGAATSMWLAEEPLYSGSYSPQTGWVARRACWVGAAPCRAPPAAAPPPSPSPPASQPLHAVRLESDDSDRLCPEALRIGNHRGLPLLDGRQRAWPVCGQRVIQSPTAAVTGCPCD